MCQAMFFFKVLHVFPVGNHSFIRKFSLNNGEGFEFMTSAGPG